MASSDVTLRVVENGQCPLYQEGDAIRLCNYALIFPQGRATCMILVFDIAETFSKWETDERPLPDPPPSGSFRCGGCKGRIRVEYGPEISKTDAAQVKKSSKTSAVAALLKDFSIFESLEERHINEIVPLLKLKKYAKGDAIITRGDPGRHLYIVLSGKVEVRSSDDLVMAFLERGEAFGEMSLLSGDPVGATVLATENSRVLRLDSRDFRQVLNRYPSLQIYFARLLARRLAKANKERADEFSSGMAGQLAEMPPVELFQALNVNCKTGSVKLTLPTGPAEAIFREGELVGARCDGKLGKAAFYDILMQTDGRFVFSHDMPDCYKNADELGNFMWLLMEGARIQDETTATADST